LAAASNLPVLIPLLLVLQAAPADTARPAIAAARATAPISIDGRLSETAWTAAPVVSRFTQVLPRDGTTPSQRTEIRILYDRDALLIAGRFFDSDPSSVVARLGRRDAETNSDVFTVALDSYHDHRTAFRFSVNAAGVKSDGVAANDASNTDQSWDPVWDAAVAIDSAGWTAEIRIPFSQLRYASATMQSWGLNFERYITRSDELIRWSWTPNTRTGYASNFGHLEGLSDIGGTRFGRLELMPYAVTQRDRETGIDAANPFNLAKRRSNSMGLDFKYGLSAGLTLTGTVNPDFGQVEADPAEVNLTVFETYFQERRPFFVEGANLFSFPSAAFAAPQLFYSRRIGRPPTGPLPAGSRFSDRPEVTSILGAAKLSGQVAGWSLGLMNATTARETADYFIDAARRGHAAVEPATNYSVLAVRRDFRRGASGLGFLGTNVYRRIDTTSLNFLRSSARAGGLDFFHRFGGNRYSINGTLAGSSIHGDSTAIIAAQRSSVRYYQRPDQQHAVFNPRARSLSGYNATLSGGKIAGAWLIGTDVFATSPGFEINDVGFQQNADRIFHGIRVTRRWLQPTKLFRYSQISATESQQWNFGGDLLFRGAYLGGNGQLHNYWSVFANSNWNTEALSDRITRGGPLGVIPRQWNVNATLVSDQRKRVTGSIAGGITRNRSGGYNNFVSLQLAARPTSAINVRVSPSFNETHSAAGYVTASVDPTATAMYGRRYIVADLTQKTIDLTTRVEMALTPTLSLQLYTQPFTSAAAYSGYKAFVRPSVYEFLIYGRDGASTIRYTESSRVFTADADGAGPAPALSFTNPDFRARSLRSNFVLRWEYRPGSSLYFAWAHGRQGFDLDPTFDVGRDLRDLSHDDHRNRFLIKASYWLNP
jgi:hypothetical protein